MLMDWRIKIVKMIVLLKAIYRFTESLSKFQYYFAEKKKMKLPDQSSERWKLEILNCVKKKSTNTVY